jgi:hypothetical protein
MHACVGAPGASWPLVRRIVRIGLTRPGSHSQSAGRLDPRRRRYAQPRRHSLPRYSARRPRGPRRSAQPRASIPGLQRLRWIPPPGQCLPCPRAPHPLCLRSAGRPVPSGLNSIHSFAAVLPEPSLYLLSRLSRRRRSSVSILVMFAYHSRSNATAANLARPPPTIPLEQTSATGPGRSAKRAGRDHLRPSLPTALTVVPEQLVRIPQGGRPW